MAVNSAINTGATNIEVLGTVTTGTWNAGVVAGQYGGSGVANTGKTITLGGNLETSGAHNLVQTLTADTNVTYPTTGTLATTTQIPSLPISPANGGTGVDNGTNSFVLAVNSSIDANGSVNIATRPKFLAYSTTTATNFTGDGSGPTFIFDATVFNVGGGYNTSTGIFTAPATGLYQFYVTVAMSGCNLISGFNITQLFFQAGTSTYYFPYYGAYLPGDLGGTLQLSCSLVLQLAINQPLLFSPTISGGTKTVSIIGGAANLTSFTGYLVS